MRWNRYESTLPVATVLGWLSLGAVAQAPLDLVVEVIGTEKVRISHLDDSSVQLEQAAVPPADEWTPVNAPSTLVGDRVEFELPTGEQQQFFRLKRG